MRSRLCVRRLVPALLLVALATGGNGSGDCLPEPESFVCTSDEDCGTGRVCNLFQFCVDAFVELALDGDWYAVGERVAITVDPNGLPIEIGAPAGVPPYTIERWSDLRQGWVALRVGTLYGCRVTGCAGGVPVELCIEPGEPWCHEHDAPFSDSWDGTHWAAQDVPCGDTTLSVLRRVTASPGNYRVVYHYGDDPSPDGAPAGSACALQTRSVTAPFGIR